MKDDAVEATRGLDARERFYERLSEELQLSRVEVLGGPSSGGWSAETVILDADGRRLVARFNPRSEGLFPAADLSTQVACMVAAREHGLPVPQIVFEDTIETDTHQPVFVMEFASGEIPRDYPPHFTEAGALFAATRDQQRAYHLDLIGCLVRLHRVPAPAILTQGPDMGSHLRTLEDLRRWRDVQSELFDDAEAILRGSIPMPSALPVLLWGDARPANTVFAPDFTIAAMLDWELAARGPAEMDVAWLLEMNLMRSEVRDLGVPVLPGFLNGKDTWEFWSESEGRAPEYMEWHHLYAAYKVALLMDLHFRAQVRRGDLPSGHRLISDNRALRRLRDLMGA